MLIFNYIPMLGLVISFKEYNPYLGPLEAFVKSPWVGLANFREAFTDKYFLSSLWNTIYYSILNLVIGFPIPIIFAILLNEITRTRFKKFVQTVSYLPHFISWVFVISFIHELLAVDNGLINEILLRLNLTEKAIPFLATPSHVPSIMVVSQVWKTFGWNSIIYIAAITNIDPTMYEAAIIDGANRFDKIRYITLPSIKPTIVIMLIFAIGGMISPNFGLFEQMYLLSNSMIQDATEIVDTYTYKMGIVLSRYSYATAVGLFRSIVAVILLTGANFSSKKLTGESLF
ncbi:MAG: sugar ABC transporter permease [Clostridiaceae bacterium]|nr:sugar ABC transporter permease [Clostridiaceae bacterium]